eukprot:CAMPEP_0195102120 /NCGR_PEP_ID=MMETSP0448-20130528/66087_1 /TAXON_ID=66468 /ORGANISM="Heterocapsa triquestra, Strain CCMP 448" /LENGTH=52 /DNA_ID=CAMNT_0040137543 /DNA_START=1 /DNA_END=155 /DNA_ORIENTATION=-
MGYAPPPELGSAGVPSEVQRLFGEDGGMGKELQFKVGAQLLDLFLSNERFFA